MQDNIPDALIAAFERHYDCSWDTPSLRNERLAWRAAWAEAMESKQCLHQIQDPAPVQVAQPAVTAALFAARGALQHLKEGGKPSESLLNESIAAIDSVATSEAAPAAVAVLELQDMLRELRVQISAITVQLPQSVDCSGVWMAHDKMIAALAATPAAAPAAVAESAPCTFMTEDQACEFAWGKVREEVGTQGWTAGESFTFHGFYLWGWNYRAQYELQRTATRSAVVQEILSAAPAAAVAAAAPAPQQSYVSISGELKPDVSVYSNQAAAPAGWKLVPIEPTAEMLESAGATDRDGTPATYKTLYMTMVGAALNPPAAARPAASAASFENWWAAAGDGRSKMLAKRAWEAALAAAEPVVLPPPDLWRDDEGLRGYAADPGRGPWYTAGTVRALLAQAATAAAPAHPAEGVQTAASEDIERARLIAKASAKFHDDTTHLGNLVYVNDLVWALGVLSAHPAPEPADALATATGLPVQAVEPSDAELIALNAGECFFSESPSKYPELGHGTQYHGGAPGVIGFARAALALRADPAAYSQKFQQRVQPWMMACFGPEISADRMERNHRFLEEALELVQSCGCTASEAHQLVDYVYGRPWGEPAQEAGGVMVTLAALCLANGLDMHACGETELARIWTKVEAIRAKQAAKPKHSPLPMHLPELQADARDAELYRHIFDNKKELAVCVWGDTASRWLPCVSKAAADNAIAAIAAAKGE